MADDNIIVGKEVKRLKNGLMTEEQKVLFLTLCAERSGEHTGGRKKELIYQLYQCKTTD